MKSTRNRRATMVSPSEMTETVTPPASTTMTTESERIESSREVDNKEEEEEKIRRQKKLEEALEAKSLRRIISAYLKYLTFSSILVSRFYFICFFWGFAYLRPFLMLGNLLQLSGGFGRRFEKMGKIISETVSFTQSKF